MGEGEMIKLTRLDGAAFVLNAEMIRYVESKPDTSLPLTSGDRIIVREDVDEVIDRALQYQQSKYLLPPNPPRPSENQSHR